MSHAPVLLVTGGSRGIGAASALLAARQGWAVAVNYQGNQAAADAVVQQIRAAGGTALAVQGRWLRALAEHWPDDAAVLLLRHG